MNKVLALPDNHFICYSICDWVHKTGFESDVYHDSKPYDYEKNVARNCVDIYIDDLKNNLFGITKEDYNKINVYFMEHIADNVTNKYSYTETRIYNNCCKIYGMHNIFKNGHCIQDNYLETKGYEYIKVVEDKINCHFNNDIKIALKY